MQNITELLRPYIYEFIELCLLVSGLIFIVEIIALIWGPRSKVPKTIVLIFGVFLLGYCVSVYFSSAEVPNVVSLNYNNAKQTIQERGLTHYVSVPPVNDNAIVINQYPPKGTIVNKNTERIELWLETDAWINTSEESPTSIDDQSFFSMPDTIMRSASAAILPYDYTTQFQDNVKGTSCKPSQMRMLFDNDYLTNYYWIIWSSVYSDDEPEFTLSFTGETISGLKIRNGNLSNKQSYYSSARIRTFALDITSRGQKYREFITLPDTYSVDYHQVRFSRSYDDVTKIEIWYHNAYKGTGDSENICYITDIEFYQ